MLASNELVSSVELAQSVHWPAVLLDATVKGLVVLGLAGVVSCLARRRSAAVRHMIWSTATVALLAIPILSSTMPAWRAEILPAWAGDAPVAPAAPVAVVAAPTLDDLPLAADPGPGVRADTAQRDAHPVAVPAAPMLLPEPTAAEGRGPSHLPVAATVTQTPAEAPRPIDWAAWVLPAWTAGAALMLAPLLIGTVAIRLRVRRARTMTDGPWPALLDELRGALGIRRPVRLLVSDRPIVPLTWGLVRPVVMLPAEAVGWPESRCRVVLLHELAHVRRADCLTQAVVQLARAVHWFNPLVYLAARTVRIERERACDDLVLSAGSRASDYADHLLDIVRTLRSSICPSLAAVAMARKSRFESRLLAILDTRRSRRGLTRLAAAVVLVAAVTLVLPLATLRPTARAAERSTVATAAPAGPRYVARLSNGGTVELLGVANLHGKAKQWWRPDGTPLDPPPYPGMAGPPSKYRYEFVIRREGVGQADDSWRVTGGNAQTNTGAPPDGRGGRLSHLRVAGVGFSGKASLQTTTIRYGLTLGPWQPFAVFPAGRNRTLGQDSSDVGVVLDVPHEKNGATFMSVAQRSIRKASRLVVFTKAGRMVRGRVSGKGITGVLLKTHRFSISLSQIDRFEFQTCPYEWVEFRNVSLKPGRRTDAQVRTGPAEVRAVGANVADGQRTVAQEAARLLGQVELKYLKQKRLRIVERLAMERVWPGASEHLMRTYSGASKGPGTLDSDPDALEKKRTAATRAMREQLSTVNKQIEELRGKFELSEPPGLGTDTLPSSPANAVGRPTTRPAAARRRITAAPGSKSAPRAKKVTFLVNLQNTKAGDVARLARIFHTK